jgi:hypothetical protein
MAPKKVFRRRIRRQGPGFDQASDVNVVVATNVGAARQRTVVSSRQQAVAKSGRRKPERDPESGAEGPQDEGEEEVTS